MAGGPVNSPDDDGAGTPELAPENPYRQTAGGQMKITTPVHFGRLHLELCAAAPGADVHAALSRKDMAAPLGPDNPGWLSWTPAALTGAAVKKVLAAHDPTPPSTDPPMRIDGSRFAGRLDDLRQRLSAGEVLDHHELSKAVSLLLGVDTPAPTP